jgi:hypothetical protein
VLEHFLDIPLLDTLSRINQQVGTLQKQLTRVDLQVANALNPPSLDGDVSKQPASSQSLDESNAAQTAAGGTFLTGVEVGAAATEASSKPLPRNTGQVLHRDAKSIEQLQMPQPFPGTEALELPGKLSANDLIKRVSDGFALGGQSELWKQCLASKEAQNLVKDFFWWFYCERYKSGMKTEDQEAIFKRMASSFARLTTLIPPDRPNEKDKFFKHFHTIMAHSVLIAYRVALPQSEPHFDEKFRSDLCRLAAYWTTGADIGPASYVLQNGAVVKEDAGLEEVESVVLQLQREQEELQDMADKRPNRSARHPTARSAGMGGSGGQAGDVPPWLTGVKAGGGAMRKATSPRSKSLQKPPPVPPLRLPVLKHTAFQYTPRIIHSERNATRRSSLADCTQKAGAATMRPASGGGVTFRGGAAAADAPGISRSVTSREAGTGLLSGARAAHPPPHLSQGSLVSAARGEEEVTLDGRRGDARDATRRDPMPTLRGRAKQYFDLKETSPFIRYHLMTQMSVSAAAAKPAWKVLHTHKVIRAWDCPVPKADEPKNRTEEEEEEEEEVLAQVEQTPREVSEAAVQHNARMVREYRKKALMRGQRVKTERKEMNKQNEEKRKEMLRIADSLELSRIFSNLLVSTGGDAKNFDMAWKNYERDKKRGTKDAAKDQRDAAPIMNE